MPRATMIPQICPDHLMQPFSCCFQWHNVPPSQQCYAGPMRALRGLPIREPYRFGRGCCSGPTWTNRTGLIWLSILSCNQKLKHANKLTFLIIFKKEHFANSLNDMKLVR